MLKIIFGIVLIFILFLGVLYLAQTNIIFYPGKLPKDYKYPYPDLSEVYIEVEKNIKLNALKSNLKDSKGVVIYFHGNAGDLSGWGGIAYDFIKNNYNVLVLDFRGYGKSDGKVESEKQLYSDAQKVFDYIKNEYPQEKIILYGRSIGTGMAAWLAKENTVHKLILETPYFDLPNVARHYYPFVPGFLLKYKFPNNIYLKDLKIPIHIIHGTKDEIIPYENSVQLKEAIPVLNFHTIEGGMHNNLPSIAEYQNILREILLDAQ